MLNFSRPPGLRRRLTTACGNAMLRPHIPMLRRMGSYVFTGRPNDACEVAHVRVAISKRVRYAYFARVHAAIRDGDRCPYFPRLEARSYAC